MPQHLAFRSVRLLVIALLAASVLAMAGPVAAGASTPAAPAAASPKASTTTYELEDAAAKVETENKANFWLLVSWTNVGEPILQVSLERQVTSPSSGFELHSWTFNSSSSMLKFNDKTGTLDSGTQANPVASVDLSFKTTSSKAATCTSGKETIYDGTLSGKASLVTGLKNGGTVSGTYTFNVATPDIEVDDGCVSPPADECGASLLAGSGNTSGPALIAGTFADVNATEQLVGISEQTALTSPAGATRTDIAAMYNESGKVYATYTGSEVKVASAGLVSGSGTVSGGKPKKETPVTCKYDGKTYTDATVIDESADYAGTFSAKPSIGTTMTVPSSTKTGLYLVTTSKET
jgi:hypothetical protein